MLTTVVTKKEDTATTINCRILVVVIIFETKKQYNKIEAIVKIIDINGNIKSLKNGSVIKYQIR